MGIKISQLVGSWRHSHEEDTATESVFRRSDFAFPPARGRVGYEFRADHACTYVGISPRDGAAREECTYQLNKSAPDEIILTFPNGQQRVLHAISATRDRLVISKP